MTYIKPGIYMRELDSGCTTNYIKELKTFNILDNLNVKIFLDGTEIHDTQSAVSGDDGYIISTEGIQYNGIVKIFDEDTPSNYIPEELKEQKSIGDHMKLSKKHVNNRNLYDGR
jgi:hypothetical protein